MTNSAKWVLVLLGVSLSINLFTAGLYVGKQMYKENGKKERTHRTTKGPAPKVTLTRMVSVLPQSKKKMARSLVMKNKASVGKAFVEHMKSRRQVYALMTAETLDIEALKKAFAHEKLMKSKVEAFSMDALITILPNLTIEERKKAARALIKTGPHFKRKIKRPQSQDRQKKRVPAHRKPKPE